MQYRFRSLPDGLPSSSGNLQIPPSLTSVGGSDNVVNEQLFSCLSQQQVLNANLLKVCRQQSVELSELRGFVSQLLGFLFPSRKISIEQLVSGNNIDSLVKEIVADCVSRFQK